MSVFSLSLKKQTFQLFCPFLVFAYMNNITITRLVFLVYNFLLLDYRLQSDGQTLRPGRRIKHLCSRFAFTHRKQTSQ